MEKRILKFFQLLHFDCTKKDVSYTKRVQFNTPLYTRTLQTDTDTISKIYI